MPTRRDEIAAALAAHADANPDASLPHSTARLLTVMFPAEDVCRLSLDAIAAEGFNRKTLPETLRRLEAAGILTKQKGAARAPNTYRLNLAVGIRP
jgi:hypothetical protein